MGDACIATRALTEHPLMVRPDAVPDQDVDQIAEDVHATSTPAELRIVRRELPAPLVAEEVARYLAQGEQA